MKLPYGVQERERLHIIGLFGAFFTTGKQQSSHSSACNSDYNDVILEMFFQLEK
jgi:hypothetical protein